VAEVFINYRTGDGDEAAELIAARLSERFGKEHIFKASHSIQPGEMYPQVLSDAARKSDVLLAVMGPDWGAAPELRDEADWVRREILTAQSSGASVVPVLKGRKTDRLTRSSLPPELRWLADVNSLVIDMRESTADIKRIGDFLAEFLPTLKAADRTADKGVAPNYRDNTNNSASGVTGNVFQGRDFTGDIRNVNLDDTNGPTTIGDGNTQNNFLTYAFTRLKAIQPLRQPVDQLRWLSDRFVAPPGFDAAQAAIRNPGTVVLIGAPGSGRTTAAQMLVFRSWSGQGKVHELEPQQPDDGSSFYIDADLIARDDGMWMDLSDADSELWDRIQKELPEVRQRVLDCRARLVIIQPHWAELRPDFEPFQKRIGKPPQLDAFYQHLRAECLANGEQPITPHSLTGPRSMSDVRRLVVDILYAKEQSGGKGGLADWIAAADQPTSPRETRVSEAIVKLTSAADRALLLSVAMLHGAHADVIDSAATSLLARLPCESETALERAPLGERLRKVGAEADAVRHVRFAHSRYEAAVRMFFWRHFPELHNTITEWVQEELDSDDLSDDDRTELARGFVAQCLDDRYQSRWTDMVKHLTAQRVNPSRELAAAAILQVGLGDEANGRTFRRQIYDWSRESGASGSLTTVLVAACQQMAETHAAEALVRLHHLARRHPGRTDVRDALAEVAHRDQWLLRLLLSRLANGRSSAMQETDARIFLDTVDALSTDFRWASQPLIARGDTARQLAAGWALAFTCLPADEWASRVYDWLRRSVEDEANRHALVDVLVEGARQIPAVFPQLYGVAHRAPFGDVIADVVLTKISAVQGVELP
jgi:hypothetical protein